VAPLLPEILKGAAREGFETREKTLREAGVSEELARRVASMPAMLAALDIVSVSTRTDCSRRQVADVFYNLGYQIELNWLRDRITELPRADRWQALARTALRDELLGLHRSLTEQVLADAEPGADSDAAIAAWREANQDAVDRCLGMLADIRAGRKFDMTTISVALREVRHLIRGGAQAEGAPEL
jgi:glutamate dehydrogenase